LGVTVHLSPALQGRKIPSAGYLDGATIHESILVRMEQLPDCGPKSFPKIMSLNLAKTG
jgi:hypothetical protein